MKQMTLLIDDDYAGIITITAMGMTDQVNVSLVINQVEDGGIIEIPEKERENSD